MGVCTTYLGRYCIYEVLSVTLSVCMVEDNDRHPALSSSSGHSKVRLIYLPSETLIYQTGWHPVIHLDITAQCRATHLAVKNLVGRATLRLSSARQAKD